MPVSSGLAGGNEEDPSDRYRELVERIRSARAELQVTTDPLLRTDLLDELGAATSALAELIVQQKGKLRSPLE